MRIIAITSGKGGAGKTFISVNLAAALAYLGKDVTLIDANFTTPNTGLFLGISTYKNTIHDLLSGNFNSNFVYSTPFGFNVVPGSLSIYSMVNARIENFDKVFEKINSEFVLLDTAAGIGRECSYVLLSSKEVFIIVNPEITSIIDALRVKKAVELMKKRVIGIIANKVRSSKDLERIKNYFGEEIVAVLPEDKRVLNSLEQKIPFIHLYPKSVISSQIFNLAAKISNSFLEFKPSFLEKMKFLWMK
ncbi:MAG: P-loop NTPase [Candidatus Aenigmatarchaeota archaeon]